jgi:hypothetical protein
LIDETGVASLCHLPQNLRKESSTTPGTRVCAGFSADEDVLFHTNTFWTEGMSQVQMPDDAVYSAQAPQFLRGRRFMIPPSSVAIILRSFWKGMRISPENHGDDNKPEETTICTHSPYWATTASLQLFPKSRRLRVEFDSACRAQHEEIVL